MLRNLLVGLPVTLLCLFLQGIFVAKGLRYYARIKLAHKDHDSQWFDIQILSGVMLLMLVGNFAQMIIWALLFLLLGEFTDFSTRESTTRPWAMGISSCPNAGGCWARWSPPTGS